MTAQRACPNCGNIQDRKGDFCAQCGKQLPDIQSPKVYKRQSTRARLLFPTTLMILLGICIIALGFYASYRVYVWEGWGTQQQESKTDLAIVSQKPMPPAVAGWTAFTIALISLGSGVSIIASAGILSLLGEIQDDIYRFKT